jgi:hypothetical protein
VPASIGLVSSYASRGRMELSPHGLRSEPKHKAIALSRERAE